MTASDLALWRAYYATLPDRQEHYLAQICALLANANFKRPDKKLFASSDFAPDLRTPTERLEAEVRFAKDQAEFAEMRERARKTVANGST